MIDNEDIEELVGFLNSVGVKYVLIGGYAVMHYAEPRYTKDIDFFVKASQENAEKIIKALVQFGIPENQLDSTLFSSEGNFFKFGRPPWRVDFMTSLKGVSFEEIYLNAKEIEFAGQQLPIISKSDLIVVKREAGRPQDLLDVEALENS
jgi:predicted nucleotidyltransferase